MTNAACAVRKADNQRKLSNDRFADKADFRFNFLSDLLEQVRQSVPRSRGSTQASLEATTTALNTQTSLKLGPSNKMAPISLRAANFRPD